MNLHSITLKRENLEKKTFENYVQKFQESSK